MAIERKETHFTLYVRGVFGRNRSEKRTHVKLARVEDGHPLPDDATLAAQAAVALADVKLKRGAWYVERRPVEVAEYADGVKIERTVLMSGTPVLRGVVGL